MKDKLNFIGTIIKQPIGLLYNTTISNKLLNYICKSDARILEGFDDEGNEIYRGYQRKISTERTTQIRDYIYEYNYATFPTSIIINIPREKIIITEFKIENIDVDVFNKLVILEIENEEGIGQIIDGQHRMSGFDNEDIEFDLPVTIFIDQLLETQAEIFATINGKQTRVTPSLVFDLFGITERDSPYKTSNKIITFLNEDKNSPLYQWIKRLGNNNDFYKASITQSAVAKNILKLICGNAKQAEDDLRKLSKNEKLTLITSFSKTQPVLRKFYVAGDDTALIKILLNFFNAVKRSFEVEWSSENSIFKKTIGFDALIKVLIYLAEKGMIMNKLTEEFFFENLKSVTIDPNVQLSSKGIKELSDQIISQLSDK